MTYSWYNVINRSLFLSTGLVSREVSLILENIGLRVILVTVANKFSITYGDTMLSVDQDGSNPFIRDGLGIFVDPVTDDVWLGIPNAS